MKLHIFASGSGGNCALLSDGDTRLLLDAGISRRRIECSLAQLGLTMQDINGVLVSHEHSDHISGLKMLCQRHSFPIYAPRTVAFHLRGLIPETEARLRILPVGQFSMLGCLRVLPFHTSHDTPESVGYRIEGSRSFAIATDTGCITEEIRQGLSGARAVVIESNHDEQLLCDGPYPFPLKRRVLSDRGHLSNRCCASLARELAEHGTEIILLAHLSDTNNRPELALAASRRSLQGTNVQLFCAPKLGLLAIDI